MRPPLLPSEPGGGPPIDFATISERLADRHLAGAAERRKLLALLLQAVSAPDYRVRAMAAEALGWIGDERALPVLLKALEDPAPLVQWQAGHALHGLRERALIPPDRVRLVEGRAFERWQLYVLDLLTAGLAGPDAGRRFEAAASLRQVLAPSTLPALLPALFDPEAAVRAEVALAVIALTGQHPEYREQAVQGLVPSLRDGDPGVRRIAADLLGRLGNRSVVRHLLPLLHDPAPGVRWSTCQALGDLRDPEASDALIQRLVDDDPWVRRSSAEALGRIGDVYAVAPLLQVSNDEQPLVRRGVVAALGQIGSLVAQPALLRALRDPDPGTRLEAARALGRLGNETALRPLAALQRDLAEVGSVRVGQAAAAAREAIQMRLGGG